MYFTPEVELVQTKVQLQRGQFFFDNPAVVKCHEPWVLRGVDGVYSNSGFMYLYIYRVGLNAVLFGINTGVCSPYSPLYSYHQTWLGNPKIAELNGGLKG